MLAGPSGITSRDLAAVGITNQRETTLLWDRDTGRPYSNAIVWADTRTAGFCAHLAAGHPSGADRFRAKTGLGISSYFSGASCGWC